MTRNGAEARRVNRIHSRKLTWKPKKGPIKTTVLLKGVYMGFHVSLGEYMSYSLNSLKGRCIGDDIWDDIWDWYRGY